MRDLPVPAHARGTCCGRPVIRPDASPGGIPFLFDVEPIEDGPGSFVVTIDDRVLGWPKANPKHTGPRYRVHECQEATDG